MSDAWRVAQVTVYEKGAQVVRMYETILGRAGFRKGLDLYFQRHDGAAVTCDDFLAAMADANGEDLAALSNWYGQSGTPRVTARGAYDAAAHTYTLTLSQTTPPTKDQADKLPLLVPVVVGLLGADGAALPFSVAEGRAKQRGDAEAVLLLEGAEEVFVLSGVAEAPTPSLLRNFSAPVELTIEGQGDAELSFLLAHDTDPFNRRALAGPSGRRRRCCCMHCPVVCQQRLVECRASAAILATGRSCRRADAYSTAPWPGAF